MSDVLVLCYHAVSEHWTASLSITPQRLEEQITRLLERGYRLTTFSQALSDPPGARTAAITFDDGFRSVFELALPILSGLGVPATAFVPTDFVGDGPLRWPGIDHWLHTVHRDELAAMDWEQLGALKGAGWEIGSHTRSHPLLSRLGDGELHAELHNSRVALEAELEGPCRAVAYPYGDVDARVAAAARRAGYRTGAALPERIQAPDPLMWPRVGVYYEDSELRFRAKTLPAMRSLQASSLGWLVGPAVRRLGPPTRRIYTAVNDRRPGTRPTALAGPRDRWGGLRLLARDGRVITDRAAVLAVGLAARAGVIDVYALWPDARTPLIVVGAADTRAARWMRATFEPEAPQRRFPDPATWHVLRAGSLLLAGGGGLAVRAAREALGRELVSPRLAAYSPTGASLSKASCFVFESDADEPRVVVKMMPEPQEAERLRHETELVELIRARLRGDSDISSALPLAALGLFELGGHLLLVQAVDHLAASTGRESRSPALSWLKRFQAATSDGAERWSRHDEDEALDWISYSWERARPERRDAVVAKVRELWRALPAQPIHHCAVHGDFWRGNIAHDQGAMRIYDWEWGKLRGRPFFDLWTYELAEERECAALGDGDLDERLALALDRVRGEVQDLGFDARFADATMAPVIAELTFRIRRVTGRAGGSEPESIRVMAGAERLLLAGE